MTIKLLARISALFLLAYSMNSSAEQNMAELVKELTTQIKELKAQVVQSNARIDQLEQQLTKKADEKVVATAPPAAQSQSVPSSGQQPANMADQAKDSKPVVTAGDTKGSFKVPGTDTSIGIGGYVKLDALYNSTGTGSDSVGNQYLRSDQIPVDAVAKGENDQIVLHAKESRFWFKSFTPSQWGDINTYLELDLYGDDRLYTYTPRLRHAYGSLGNLLAGQTWSTFLNNLALADTLDAGNSQGALFGLRQPQVRWTQPFTMAGTPMEWLVALEAPRSRIWDGSQSSFNLSHYPDLVARFNYLPSWGNLSLAVMGRQAQYTPQTNNQEKSVWGGAVSLAGKINTFGSDNVRFMLNYGNAMGRYAANSVFADAAVDANGNMELIPIYSGMLAYQHWWNNAWRSTVEYGISYADQPIYAATANQQVQSVHANLLWSPISQATIGLEYIYANRELLNGQNGDLNRVQFSTRFNF